MKLWVFEYFFNICFGVCLGFLGKMMIFGLYIYFKKINKCLFMKLYDLVIK